PGPSCPPEEAVSSPSGTRLEAGGFRPEWHAAARPLEAASNPGGTPFRGPRRSLSREEIGGGMGCYPFRRPSHGRGRRPPRRRGKGARGGRHVSAKVALHLAEPVHAHVHPVR